MLVLQDLFLRTLRPATLLTPDLLHPLFFGADFAGLNAFDPVQEQPSGQKAVQGLGALLLAFYGKPRGGVDEKDAGGGFVDLLAAGAGRADESFPEIVFGDAQALHPGLKGRFFFGRDVEQVHGSGRSRIVSDRAGTA